MVNHTPAENWIVMEYMPLGDLKTFLMVCACTYILQNCSRYILLLLIAFIPFTKHRKTLDQ